jgi:predicted esterase YcpF (UPF0227 family)
MIRLIYLHGFNSSPQTIKGRQLAAWLGPLAGQIAFDLPALPHRPALAIALVERLLAQHAGNDITLLGSSLGGYYATFLAEKHGLKAVLINPAILPDRDLEQFLGPQRNLYTDEPYELTRKHLEEMSALRVARITRPDRYYLLVQTGDEVLDYREAVRYYAGAKQRVIEGGDHGFQDFEREIPEILYFAGKQA